MRTKSTQLSASSVALALFLVLLGGVLPTADIVLFGLHEHEAATRLSGSHGDLTPTGSADVQRAHHCELSTIVASIPASIDARVATVSIASPSQSQPSVVPSQLPAPFIPPRA